MPPVSSFIKKKKKKKLEKAIDQRKHHGFLYNYNYTQAALKFLAGNSMGSLTVEWLSFSMVSTARFHQYVTVNFWS
jgi:hypothetical protein